MASANDRSDGGKARGSSNDQGSHAQQPLESGRQIALDILEADRQALELHPPSWPLSSSLRNGRS